MNIKRALTLIAIGFAFTALDFEVTIAETSVELIPNFVGFLLLYIAYNYLGEYVKDQKYLRWCALILTVFYAIEWISPIIHLDDNEKIAGVLQAVNQSLLVVSGVYFFLFFDVLAKIAVDYEAPQKKSIRFLKFINFGSFVFISFIAFLTELVPSGLTIVLVLLTGLVAIVASLVTMVVLFRFRMALDKQGKIQTETPETANQ